MVTSVLIPVRRMHGVSCNQGSWASLRVQNSGVYQSSAARVCARLGSLEILIVPA